MKKVFITFGGPTKNYHEAVIRICRQAKSFDLFDEIIGYTEKDLVSFTDFWNRHKDFINNNPRGYGYWLWKPFLVLKNLEKLSDGDILIYADAGCELNIKGKEKLKKLLLPDKDFVVKANRANSNSNSYTKMDAIKYFDIDFNSNVLKQGQMEGSVLIIKKSVAVLKLFEEFYDICSNNYCLIDDSASIVQNHKGFVEHRHDQSVFTLLMIKKGWLDYSLEEYVFNSNSILSNASKTFFLIRNRSGLELVNEYIKHYPYGLVQLLGRVGKLLKKHLPGIYFFLKPYFPNQNSVSSPHYFNGDTFLAKNILDIIKKEKIVNVVETGTYLADTTKFFSENVGVVYTVECNTDYYMRSKARNDLGNNINFFLGNSWEILDREIIPQINGKTIFYLDAHWDKPCPTLLELDIIAKHGIKPIIVIHDFKVPNHPELGWDSYPDFEYKIENIEVYLENIYGRDGYRYEYNSRASGAKRGVIIIYPK
ncbi:MAG: hypothetical protein WCF94_03625 [bacterium]